MGQIVKRRKKFKPKVVIESENSRKIPQKMGQIAKRRKKFKAKVVIVRENSRKIPEKMRRIVERRQKWRPSKVDLATREPPTQERDMLRSLCRRNVKHVFDLNDDIFADDGDQRLEEKKLKLSLKLQLGVEPEPTSAQQSRGSRRVDHAPPTLPSYSENGGDKLSKKRRIGEGIEEELDSVNDEEDEKVKERKSDRKTEGSRPGSREEAQFGTTLPDKRILELILDKLQKIDVYQVFAEPVDPEVHSYYNDVIKYPMDFATVRKKLGNGSYATFEDFESDVFLICSNGMLYSQPDLIYHKQARSIKKLAEKEFHKIRLNIERSEKEINLEQKRISDSISKNHIKRSMSRSVQKLIDSDFSAGGILGTVFDLHDISNALLDVEYEICCRLHRIVEADFLFNDNKLDKEEELLSGKGPLSKLGRKSFVRNDNRRATYTNSLAQPLRFSESISSTFEGESKLLIPVGFYSLNAYARSLARFAATLGSVAWKVASTRIEQALSHGQKYGRGWVREYEPFPTPELILENCNVKEPPFFSKLNPDEAKKIEKIPKTSNYSQNSLCNVFFSDRSLPFLGFAVNRQPSAPVTTLSLSSREQHVLRDVSEAEPAFFLSPGSKRKGSAIFNHQHENSKTSNLESGKKVMKQVELNTPASFNKHGNVPLPHKKSRKSSETEPSRSIEFASRNVKFSPSESFKQPDSNRGAGGGLPFGKVVANRLDGNAITCSSSNSAKAHKQGQGLSEPVQLTRMFTENAQNQQKSLNQVLSSAPRVSSPSPLVLSPAPSIGNDPHNASARAWMSVGQNSNSHKNHIYANSLYNPIHSQPQVPRFCGELPASGIQVQPERSRSPAHAFVPQGPKPMSLGNELHIRNQQLVFQQFVTADLSRSQMQPTFRNVSPQMHLGRKNDLLPLDLNIAYQSSWSPDRSDSGVIDSQQLDLALQL